MNIKRIEERLLLKSIENGNLDLTFDQIDSLREYNGFMNFKYSLKESECRLQTDNDYVRKFFFPASSLVQKMIYLFILSIPFIVCFFLMSFYKNVNNETIIFLIAVIVGNFLVIKYAYISLIGFSLITIYILISDKYSHQEHVLFGLVAFTIFTILFARFYQSFALKRNALKNEIIFTILYKLHAISVYSNKRTFLIFLRELL